MLAERCILLVPAAIPIAVEISAVFEYIASAVIKSALAVESATFLAIPFAFEAVATLVSPVFATFSITFVKSAILAKTVSATFTKATFAILSEPARVLLLLKRFTTFIKATTFVPFVSPAVLDFFFFRA